MSSGRQATYLPTGHLVFVESGSLMATPFDLERLQLGGDSVPALADPEKLIRDFAVSDNGTLALAYVPLTECAQSALVKVDREGGIEPLVAERRAFWQGNLSPDGRRLA